MKIEHVAASEVVSETKRGSQAAFYKENIVKDDGSDLTSIKLGSLNTTSVDQEAFARTAQTGFGKVEPANQLIE